MTTTARHEPMLVLEDKQLLLPESEVLGVLNDQYAAVEDERRPFTMTVSLGTDHHPFERLIEWIDDWVDQQEDDVIVYLQAGFTEREADGRTADFIDHERLSQWFGLSDVVVVQGGPGGILDARTAGRLPIVVPRRAHLGEHVDDHQVIFARAMANAGRVISCETQAELHSLLTDAKSGRLALRIPEGSADLSKVSARVAASVGGRRLPTKSVINRLGFSLARSGDHHFDPESVAARIA